MVAYIHDAYRSRESLAETEAKIRRGRDGVRAAVRAVRGGHFTVMVLRRAGGTRFAAR